MSKRDFPAVETLAKDLVSRVKGTNELSSAAYSLNGATSGISLDKNSSDKELEFAERIAKMRVEAAGETDGAVLDTLARVVFRLGRKEEAIQLQERAIKQSPMAKLKEELEKTLKSYKKGELPAAE